MTDLTTEKIDFVLRLPAVKARTGLARSTIYLLVATGSFPKPIKLGQRAVGWLETDVQHWLQGRVEKSRGAARASERFPK